MEIDSILLTPMPPPNPEHKKEYIQNMQNLLKKLNITSTNSIILGDINDFTASYLDRWSSYSTSDTQRGEVLNTFRKLKYYDMFHTLHPEWKCYSWEGIRRKNTTNSNNSNTKVITSTRLDYILTAPSIIHSTQCCVILDNYNIGSDHRPVFASITADKAIPHIASKDRTPDLAEPEIPLQNQPTLKYIKERHNEAQWEQYTENAITRILTNEILQQPINCPMGIDNFVQELTHILDKTTEETVKWNTHNPSTPFPVTNAATSTNEVASRKDKKLSEYCHVPAGQLPGNTIRFQNKINHTLFKKS